MRVRIKSWMVCLSLILAGCLPLSAGGQARHFVLMVWDGMRPDFVTPELTPTLWALRAQGVWLGDHHSAFPTATEVNGAVLATGLAPEHSGILANAEYRREVDPLGPFGTQVYAAVRRSDAVSGGRHLGGPTLAERLRARGEPTAIVGSKSVAFLHDRLPRPADSKSWIWFADGALPESLLPSLTNRLGLFPAAMLPNVARDEWATRCLTDVFWEKGVPRYSVLWLSEPDLSQHNRGPGSPTARAAIRNCDQRLATVLRALERHGVREQTDLILVSDHGFSTIAETIDVTTSLRTAGIPARRSYTQPPRPGEVVTVGNGGAVLIYVTDHTPAVVEQIVTRLQGEPFTGVLFTRDGLPGTFKLAEVRMGGPHAPDVLMVSRWRLPHGQGPQARSEVFLDGTDWEKEGGMHVTLSPKDLKNLGFAIGPDFKRGVTNTVPSGNVDIVPTLLWLMNVQPEQPLDGRVLSEALTVAGPAVGTTQPVSLEAKQNVAGGTWSQFLRAVSVNGVRYMEEGNGFYQPRGTP